MIALALLAAAAAPLSCGAVPRPGIATMGENGAWRGAAVEACRHAAVRLGRPGFRFHGYRTRDALRASAGDDIAFLSAAERSAAGTDRPVIAPQLLISTQVLVTKAAAPTGVRPTLCFIIATAAQDALETWLAQTHRDAVPLGFQEPDEMADGLLSGTCAAMAVDAAERASDDRVVETLATLSIDAVADPAKASMVRAALSR